MADDDDISRLFGTGTSPSKPEPAPVKRNGPFLGVSAVSDIEYDSAKGFQFYVDIKSWWNPIKCNYWSACEPTELYLRFNSLSKKRAPLDPDIEEASRRMLVLDSVVRRVLYEIRQTGSCVIWNKEIDKLAFDIIGKLLADSVTADTVVSNKDNVCFSWQRLIQRFFVAKKEATICLSCLPKSTNESRR